MKLTKFAFLAPWLCLLTATALAQSPVTITIDTHKPGRKIPADFAGLSIFTGTQVAGHRGKAGNLFSGTNTQMITLFKNSGIHHLRLGATGSSTSGGENLSHADIDALFAFAKATDIKVIYSLHGNGAAATAQYVWEHYRPFLDCFAFDNEPDKRAGNDAQDDSQAPAGKNYFTDWRSVAQSVLAVLPEAKFAGPDAAGRTLLARFIKREKDLGCIALVTQHTYVGGNSTKRKVDAPHAIDALLSREWPDKQYPAFYRQALEFADKQNLPYRITELNDYVHGVTNASDAFASALWALDCLHWWAVRGVAGINFQNTEWIPTDTFYLDAEGNYQIHPKAYGIKAFELGGMGRIEAVSVNNNDNLNITAYAARDANALYVTVINKEHGSGARNAMVTIEPGDSTLSKASVIFLNAPELGAKSKIILGGSPIANDELWQGKWTPLTTAAGNSCAVAVNSASAAVVKITGPLNSNGQ
jgi:hypothetical protein